MQKENENDSSADEEIAALSYMAMHHYKKGQLQQAQDVCQRILRKQQRADAILILGMIAHEQRDFEVAAERYQQFLAIEPNHAQTHYYLGLVLNKLGHTELAVEHLNKSITLDANNAAAHNQLGDAYTLLRRWEEAAKAYQHVLAIQAEDVATTIKLGNVFLAAQLLTKAISLYERALTILPDNALLHRHLGASLHRMGETQRAISCFKQSLSLRPDYVGARIDLAQVLRRLGRAEEALVQLEEAIGLEPHDVDSHISLALTLRQLGQTDSAIERLEQFLSAKPNCGSAYYHISMMKPRQELIPVVEKLVSDSKLPKNDAISCHFALGNLLDDSKSFDQAFSHYLTANTLEREKFDYDPRENIEVFDKLIKVYTKRFFQDKRQFGSVSELPVFIVGLPRSGTTLVEQIVSSHALVHGAGEIEALPGANLSVTQQLSYAKPSPECMALIDGKTIEKYSARYLEELELHCTVAERITDKLPGNFARIGFIRTLFPDARIIHCQRNPLDNCVSVFFHCFTALQCSFDLKELGQFYRDYQRLMTHWQSLFPGEILTVQYEDLVADQEKVSRRMIDHLGLEWDDNCLDFHNNERNVMTPSNVQVRQPMYTSSINRWHRYEKNLQPLIKVLQEDPAAGSQK